MSTKPMPKTSMQMVMRSNKLPIKVIGSIENVAFTSRQAVGALSRTWDCKTYTKNQSEQLEMQQKHQIIEKKNDEIKLVHDSKNTCTHNKQNTTQSTKIY